MSKLLLKLEYAVLFFSFGVVITVSGLAYALDKDPMFELRSKSVDTYNIANFYCGTLAVALIAIQSSVLIACRKESLARTGKSQFALGASLAASVASVAFVAHYYFLVYKKAAINPKFQISFDLKGDGSASFLEYMIFSFAVVLVAALGTPEDWRLSLKAFLVSSQSVLAGFCVAVTLFDGVLPNCATVLLSVSYVQIVIFVLGTLLLLARVAIVFSSKTILTFIHLCAVSFSLVPIVVAQYNPLFTGVVSAVPTLAFGSCGKTLLVVVALQCLLDSYGNKQPQVIKVPSAKAQTKAKAGAEATAITQKPRRH